MCLGGSLGSSLQEKAESITVCVVQTVRSEKAVADSTTCLDGGFPGHLYIKGRIFL